MLAQRPTNSVATPADATSNFRRVSFTGAVYPRIRALGSAYPGTPLRSRPRVDAANLSYPRPVFRVTRGLVIIVALVLAALVGCRRDVPRRLPVYVPPLPDGSVAIPSCVDRARWIYVVDEGLRLLRFAPTTLDFVEITSAPLNCPASAGAFPFSMAVDHDATAWVLYSDGSLHRVSTLDGRCTASGYVPNQQGIATFGMAFATVDPAGALERLYVVGSNFDGGTSSLGIIDTGGLALALVGPAQGSPELTGNALAELWGFFPMGTPTISQLETGSGAVHSTFDLATLGPDTLAAGAPRAWAFAFWGGDYWVFYRSQDEASTQVYRFRPPAGAAPATFTRMRSTPNLTIVGAGVSTCVPYILE